jgi:hypothetical protein
MLPCNCPKATLRFPRGILEAAHSLKIILIKLLNLCRDCESIDAPRVNNIGYVLSGYDIYHGNPIPTSGIVDPGFRSLIFQG